MNQLIEDLIAELYDEHPQPHIICSTPGDYTPRLVSQLNLKRTARTRQPPLCLHVCSRTAEQEAQP